MKAVVKVGTSTLAHVTGRLNIRHIEELCKVLSDLKNAGHAVSYTHLDVYKRQEDLGAELRFLTLEAEEGADQVELLRRQADMGVDAAVVIPADCAALEQQLDGCLLYTSCASATT